MKAKTRKEYTDEWVLHVRSLYSVSGDVIDSDFDLGLDIAGAIETLVLDIRKAGDILAEEGVFTE